MHSAPPDWNAVLSCLIEKRDLAPAQVRWVMEEVMQGKAEEAQTAAFLMGLRIKGESAAEIAEAAQVLRAHMVRWDTGRDNVLDTCGTGGDGTSTFNISTAVAFVVAGAGVPVVKHGNRSVSSKSGSADVLAALDVPLEASCEHALRSLNEAGLAFCFAPHFHPALRHAAPVRKKLGFATIFNCLGPLANPAGAQHQLLGVGRPALLDLLAGALALLGTRHALLVHGADGLDEVTLSGITHVRRVQDGKIESLQWSPDDFGLPRVTLEEVRVADATESARVLLDVLEGREGPALNLVLANAAAALLAAGTVQSVRRGVALAQGAIETGQAREVLARLASSPR